MDFSKIKKSRKAEPQPEKPNTVVEAIIKVDSKSYVPAKIKVRARIDEFMFTTETTTEQLELLKDDEKVISVQKSQKIRSMEPMAEKQESSLSSTADCETEKAEQNQRTSDSRDNSAESDT